MVEIKLVRLDPKLHFPKDCAQYVSFERRVKIMNYKNDDDKKRSLISELLIRAAAHEKLNIPAEKCKISYNPYGKPYIDNVRHFKFNISHSGGYVAIATGRQKVGVDIELKKEIDMSVAKRFFTQNEYEYIRSFVSESDRRDAFYTLWTLKESYIKAVGKGLKIPLNSFELTIGDKISVKDNTKYNFKFICKRIEGYAIAVCYVEEKVDDILYCEEEQLYQFIRRVVKQNEKHREDQSPF